MSTETADTALARWVGPFPTTLPDGTDLAPGDTFHVPESHLASGHWERVETPAVTETAPAPSPAPPSRLTPVPSTSEIEKDDA